jgi:hypothetical protein
VYAQVVQDRRKQFGAQSMPIIRRPTGARIPRPPTATGNDNGKSIC